MKSIILLSAFIVVAAACESASSPSDNGSPSPGEDLVSYPSSPGTGDVALPKAAGAALANDIAMLAVARPASNEELASLAAKGYTREVFSSYIDDLVVLPEVSSAAEVIIELKWPMHRFAAANTILKTQVIGGETIYYAKTPCKRAEAELVKPWWDLDTKVLVCKDSHAPEVFATPEGNHCSGVYSKAENVKSPCGCGPNLMRCTRDEQQAKVLLRSTVKEGVESLRYVIQNRMPFSSIFSSVNSFRNGYAEFMYQRFRVENREVPSIESLPDWRTWPEEGKWAPRYELKEGMHAGVFTQLSYPGVADSLRGKLSEYYNVMWCSKIESLFVAASVVLDNTEGDSNLRGGMSSWEKLARLPVCGNCHARMDYAVQFFTMLPFWFESMHYDPKKQKNDRGMLYDRDINDPQVEGTRNPQGWVQAVMSQPQYPACMSERFLGYAFSTATEPELAELDERLQKVVREDRSYGEIMQTLLEGYTDLHFSKHKNAAVAKSMTAVELVDEFCSACHEDESPPTPPSLVLQHGENWCDAMAEDCSRVAVEIVSAVAFGYMPKKVIMGREDRVRLIEALAPNAWPEPATREAALRYFVETSTAPPVHDMVPILVRAKQGHDEVKAGDTPFHPGFTAGMAAVISVVAAKICGDDKECMGRALDAESIHK